MTTTRLETLTDVAMRDGGHVLAWSVTMRDALRVLEMVLLTQRVEVRESLRHRRWRVLSELPPRVRAVPVLAQLTAAIALVRAANLAVDRFKTTFAALVEDERATQRAAEQQDGGAV